MRYRITLLFLLLMLTPFAALAQTAATTTVSGTVTDANGAVIAKATVKLTDMATNAERTATTNSDGQYSFYTIPPGDYKVTVTAQGFKSKVITDVKASATIVATVNTTLDVGQVDEIVQVAAGVEAELQTADASIGTVMDEVRLKRLPNASRQANTLFALQPAVTPQGQFAGARSDQSTIQLDGIDVSDNVVGATFRSVISVPLEWVEEFRGTSANANATFGRGSGGQITLSAKGGTNQFHGSAYLYHQDNALNANSWTNNRLGLKRPFHLDNRFGGTVGGPIIKDKTFFFVGYEGRRNPSPAQITRLVPTDTLKAGTLRFRDSAGVIQTIDANAIKALDPRGLGVNPKMLEYLRLYPAANDFTQGDGLNTAGLVFNAPLVLKSDAAIARLDHRITEKWSFNGKFQAERVLQNAANQVDLRTQQGTNSFPSRPRNAYGAVTTVIKPNMTNEARFSWLHDRLGFNVISLQPFVGLNAAINFGGTVVDDIVDVDTQRARNQFRTLNIYQWSDNLTWTKGTHNMQFGGNIRRIRSVDFRDDKVIGSITTPVAEVSTTGGFVTVPAAERPNFIQAADTGRYNTLYAGLLGMVSTVPALITRDANLRLQPLGTGLLTYSTLKAWEFYFQDTWRWKPSLTITYGLNYNWQEPPIEDSGKQTVIVFQGSNQLVNYKQYLKDKLAASQNGTVYNPDIAYLPLKDAGRKTAYDIDWSNLSPRFAMSWNPTFKSGLFNKVFGDRQTVVRGGYSLTFDRTNTVQTIIIPTLGVGFAQTVSVNGPKNAAGQAYRIGVDGAIPLPTAPQQVTPPVIPAKPFGETLSFSVDPFIKVPKNHIVDFTIQREMPWRMLVEVGYIGRFARDLYINGNLNSAPFFHKDNRSGQTFAQAFDAVARSLRPGGGGLSSVVAQPYFENLYGAGVTQRLASTLGPDFINGNISNIFQTFLDVNSQFGGFLPNSPVLTNLQSLDLFVRHSGAISNYHGMVLTVRKRFSQGMAFDANYTWSKSLDQSTTFTQNNVSQYQTSYFPDFDYGPSLFDLRHVFNLNGSYELPFGKGRFFDMGNGALNKVVGGWTMSGIFQTHTGFPLSVSQSAQAFGGGAIFGPTAGAIKVRDIVNGTGVFSGVIGSNGFGISGDPARRGSGLNLFSSPEQAFNSYRRLEISRDTRDGRGTLRGLNRWFFDFSMQKETKITEKIGFTLSFDFLNVFNNVVFNDPALNLQNPAAFGVITSQFTQNAPFYAGPRRIQIGARFDF
ncbi:MAG: carboxypeptidase-like regulatory domain-containing protein [Acidobacteriota bacterium]|nr:carboxypeptidase-like regulatory domain-containing protein [Acidobacteriota bacterium]